MDKQTFFSSVWNVFAFLMDEQGMAFLLLPCSLSREPSPKPSAPTSHTSHLPARLCCSVSKKDVDTEGAHTRGIIQPPNRPRADSVVLEYSGPLDGKEGLPLLLRFESSLLPLPSLLFRGPDSEKVLEVVAPNCPPQYYLLIQPASLA